MCKKGMGFRPKEILFSPTARCNLACTHCDIKKTKGILSAKTAKRFLLECKGLGINRIGFTGGEPFLADSFLCDVAGLAAEEGMFFSRIMTNAVWYKTEDELENTLLKLHACGYDGEISISIDAFHAQRPKKIIHFINTALSVWKRPDLISIVCVTGARQKATENILWNLARSLGARLIGFNRRHAYIKNDSLFIKIYKIGLSPIGAASRLKNGWDGKWFKEDYCKGPGNVFFVLPSGDVKPCCGYATDSKRLTIGNIKHDSAKAIMRKVKQNRFVSAVFNSGLARIRKRLEDRGVVFPGKASNNCYFCNYILKKALIAIMILTMLVPYSHAQTQVLKKSKDYAAIKARAVNKIKLPRWYHEGLFYDGQNMWVLNGKKGKVWVVDTGSGAVKKEIEHVAGFAEGMTKRGENIFYVTDWDEKSLYTVKIEDNKMIPLSGLSLAPAFPAGVVWSGADLFVITWTRGLAGTRFDILQMNERLELVRKVAIRHIPEPSQLAWDGRNLWITSWFKRLVYKVDVNRWEIAGAFKSPVPRATGIAWDGKYMWITGTYSDLYQMEIGKKEEGHMSINVTSSAFKEGGMISRKYTCDGDDISPPLAWSGIPQNTRTIALISDDPDAPMGTWVHWVLFNMPPDTKGLPEGVPGDKVLANGAKQGVNDGRQTGYGGPCPPSGTHRYYFKVYALDKELGLNPGCAKKDLVKAMEGHILAEGQLMGRYKR